MTETTLERAARALFKNDPRYLHLDDPEPVWERVRGDLLDSARVVVMAVRDISTVPYDGLMWFGDAREVWPMVIDAILAEGGTLATSPGVD